jgi:carbamoyl-phosphate synthase/aspartate carbamoyltransferase
VSPRALSLPREILELIQAKPGQLLIETTELTPEVIAQSDVLYCTRVQKERFDDLEEYERLKDSFVVDNRTLRSAKASMIVMHPLPRNREIGEEVDFDQRAAYFRQVYPVPFLPSSPISFIPSLGLRV